MGRHGIQVIARAAAILRALKEGPDGLSLSQIAQRAGLARSTVQRIVQSLQAERLVMAASPDGGIRLGPEIQSLGDAARVDFVKLIRPLLQDLWRDTGETVDLAVLRDNRLIFIDQIPGTHRLRAVSSIGVVFPLTNTANGKACLALMPDTKVKEIAKAEWIAEGVRGNLSQLLRDLRAVRKTGVAYDANEHTEGISAVGIAFRDEKGSYYAVSSPTPSARFVRNRRGLTSAILRLARLVKSPAGKIGPI
jgi:DNA-binding IclR family transcriptional regulator